MRIYRTLCALGLTVVSGCGGGGGGGGTGPVKPTAFTSWSAVQPNTPVEAEGISQSASDTFNVGGLGGGKVVNVTNTGPFTTVQSATATLSFDASHQLQSLSISTPSASASWSTTAGDSISCTGGICSAGNNTGSGILADPYALGWNYQSFGAWTYDTNSTVSPRTGNIGAMSIGAMTPPGALPTTGTAIYSGRAAGFYINSAGVPFLTGADMSATANFAARSVQFSTSNTNLTNLNTLASSSNTALNLNGTLNLLSGVNRFVGNVTTAGGTPLNGTATGSFYGPTAQEIGGIYSLKGSGPEAMTGGFGGKR